MEALIEMEQPTIESVETAKDIFIQNMLVLTNMVVSMVDGPETSVESGYITMGFVAPDGFAFCVSPIVGESIAVEKRYRTREADNLQSVEHIDEHQSLEVYKVRYEINRLGKASIALITREQAGWYKEIYYPDAAKLLPKLNATVVNLED